MSGGDVVMETERLVLRQPVLEDFEGYVRLFSDREVARSLSIDGRPLSRYEAWRSFAGQVGHWQLRGYGMFSVYERGTGAFVGRVGPWYPEGWPGLEVGWSLLSSFWGRGYATEAAAASIGYAFSHLGQARVISLILPDNLRSIGVATRIGETLTGETTLPHIGDRVVRIYSISREEWEARVSDPRRA